MGEMASDFVGESKLSSTYEFIRLREFCPAALPETISLIFTMKAIVRDPLILKIPSHPLSLQILSVFDFRSPT